MIAYEESITPEQRVKDLGAYDRVYNGDIETGAVLLGQSIGIIDSIDDVNEIIERIIKEAVHELGHTFSIRHCSDSSCVMHYCRSLNDVDNKKIRMCRYCSVMLEDEKKRIEREAAAFV